MVRNRFAFLIGFLFLATGAFAQQNDVAITFGTTFSPGINTASAIAVTCPVGVVCTNVPPTNTSLSPAFAVEGTFAHRIADFKVASLHIELPVMAAPNQRFDFAGSGSFSSVFFTPSVKLKLAPSAGISPFFSAGGGFGHFSQSNISDTKAAFQMGGGLDFKTRLPLLGFRVEARDFLAGVPTIPAFASVTNGHINNIFVGGGITLHF